MHFTAHIACVCLHVCTACNAINKLYNEWPSMPVNIFDIMSSIRMGERCEVDIITPVFLFFLLLCVCVCAVSIVERLHWNMHVKTWGVCETDAHIQLHFRLGLSDRINLHHGRTEKRLTTPDTSERYNSKTSMHNVREIDVRHVVWCPRTSH